MKKTIALFLLLISTASAGSGFELPAQNNFDTFWKKFKTAVKDKDKTAVAELSKFPLEMPYGQTKVKNKTQLSSRFSKIFNGEADAAACFKIEVPEKENSKRYVVTCGIKNSPNDDKPIVYSFELTKTGWKFAGLDNINE